MESDSLPFSVTLSDDITPPLSPVLQGEDQPQKRMKLSQDIDIPWAPPRFECCRHRSSSSWSPDNNGFLASRTLSRLLEGSLVVVDQHEGLTTQLFGCCYVTSTALLDQISHLFSTLR
nr:uncharacterized protein LOC129258451 [Lytechinus pictus]